MPSPSSAWQQEGVHDVWEPPNPPAEMGTEITYVLMLLLGQVHAAACSESGLQGGLERKRLHQSLE